MQPGRLRTLISTMKQLVRRSLAYVVARVPVGVLIDKKHADIYQAAGFHVVPDHFYEPIPNTDRIDRTIWERPTLLAGVKTNVASSLAFFREGLAAGYMEEFHRFPAAPTPDGYGRDGSFGGLDGAFYYCALRRNKPRQVIEIGAGQSTLLARHALKLNDQPWRLTAIDPFPEPYLLRSIQDQQFKLIVERVERVPLSLFKVLDAGDMLFIDSSHVVRIDGDVIHEILEILPRLNVGVSIYIHDIYLPFHYPKELTLQRRIFWTEQYLLQAFLAFNDSFEIEWSAGLMVAHHLDEMKRHFPYWDNNESQPSSLIIRRVR